MAKPLATDKELNMMRKMGMEVNAENLRKVKELMRVEAIKKSEARNKKGMKAGPSVTEPTGYAKGGMVKKKGKMYANCGASVPASKKK